MQQKAVTARFENDIACCFVVEQYSKKICTKQCYGIVHSKPDKQNEQAVSEHRIQHSDKQKPYELVLYSLQQFYRSFYQLFKHSFQRFGLQMYKKNSRLPFFRYLCRDYYTLTRYVRNKETFDFHHQ